MNWMLHRGITGICGGGGIIYSGLAARFGAWAIDALTLYFVSKWSFLLILDNWGRSVAPLIMLAIMMGYFVLSEGIYGQTIGKKVFHIKVTKEDGSPCGLSAAFIRNIFRIVDGLPALYIIGVVSVCMSDKLQRIGDRVAKTIVIKT